MKKIIFSTILFSIICYTAFSQNAKPDAVYRKLIKEYTLNPDGSSTFRLYKEVQLNTHYSFNRQQGETFIVYNPEYQKLKINEAYTIMADGKKVTTPGNAFNEVLPRFASRVPTYNHLREMVVTHTGLEVGAVIYLDYSIDNAAGFLPAFMGNEPLFQEAPVTEMNLIVRIPMDKELKQKTYNIRTAPEITEEKGMKVYKWIFRDLDAMPYDRNVDNSRFPRVIFSTVDLKRAFFKMVAQPAFTFMGSQELSQVAKKVADEEKDDLSRIMKLRSIVNNDLKTWNIPEKYTGYACRTPDEVWKSNGGTPLEKSVLLSSLLIKAGINARPVAVFPGMFYDESLACLGCIEDYIVQANPKEEEQWYISPTNNGQKNMKYSLPGKTLLVLDGAIESLRTYNESQETGEINFGLGLVIHDTSNMTGTMTLEMTKQFNPFYKLSKDKEDAATMISGISKKEITNIEMKKLNQHNALINYEVKLEKPFKILSGYIFWTLPQCREGLAGWHIGYLTDERTTPFAVPELIKETNEYSISYPENMELTSTLKNTELDYSFGKLVISMKQKKQEIFIKHELEIREGTISLADYTAFKEMINIWVDPAFRKLVFKYQTY